ncbi:short-chain dehydrogenase [Pseudoclavibacter sp. RFBJ3]|uniref:SDR family NAD(P)-dependent oxidoreductase n=1 Tax=unclassified Pseudoclavibacter TaxID=2615177 RepID=UPI000CE86531|nr:MULTISPECIES: SDR family oxidoreductase [unclassified Pseudoclavibacter]PPF80005.1 short-chain dehydrogenase [Pseudoclavibacter sp. RFBJ5]PPF95393.1 short-chain dehydrogenase [Pseudoclavibacter sp. RFBJ3]PPF95868.1 short-chain dehydrogenase [Pseudoclavibacter sp. RFBH5]PPG17389.1 short-chain dehydrogenase [Pseudoclavibacter sp. RFBI4]
MLGGSGVSGGGTSPSTGDSRSSGGTDRDGEFGGRVAIVTGGASGIGAAVAEELLARGAQLAVFDLDGASVAGPALGVSVDVSDRASVDAGVAAVLDRFGRLDVVVNCAGIGAFGTVEDSSDDDWARVLDVNVRGVARVCAAAMPALRESDAAAIVNLTSIAATTGIQQRALYSATKGAVHALTLAMAADHVHDGIRVNAVSPGTTDTPWVQRMVANVADPEAERAAMNARQPTGRLVTPAEVAGAVAYLASPLSASTTGSVLSVDGGFGGLRVRPVQA